MKGWLVALSLILTPVQAQAPDPDDMTMSGAERRAVIEALEKANEAVILLQKRVQQLEISKNCA